MEEKRREEIVYVNNVLYCCASVYVKKGSELK